MKKKFIIQKKTIKNFVIIFVAATLIFTGVRFGANAFFNANVFHGETTDEEGNTVEAASLLRDMNPIAVDEGSPFYEMFQRQQRVNILCLGVNDGMTDTIMLMSYDMDNQKVDIISIPRDTYYYRGSGYDSWAHHKINAIYSARGVVQLAETVSEMLHGMPIHYYAIVEYDDVKEVMKTIGGVQMNIPFHMKYDDTTKGHELHIDIPEGNQIIDSSNVMEFLRFRHTNPWFARQGYKSYEGGDIQRQELQQEFVKKVIAECLKAGNIADVAKIALQNVESDMTYGMAAKIALKAMDGLSAENVKSYMLPGYAGILHELSFWIPYEDQVIDMLNEVYADPIPQVPEAGVVDGTEAPKAN